MSSKSTTEQVSSGTGPKTGDDSNEGTGTRRSVLAYLGPAGTYSHQVLLTPSSQAAGLNYLLQVACDRFAETVHYYPRDTISGLCKKHFRREGSLSVFTKLTTRADVFHSVGPSVHLGLVPQENSIFGIVTETYDLLRSTDIGESKWIRGAVTLSIQHCLVVRRGKTVRDIKRVLSHEQVRVVIFFGRHRAVPSDHLVYVTLSRPWDSVGDSFLNICLRCSWLVSPPRLRPRKRSRRRWIVPPTAQRFAPRSAYSSSPIWRYCTRVFRTNMVS